MTLPIRVGVSLPLLPDVAHTLASADWAEAQGFDGVWFADGGDADSLTLMAAVAQRTRRVRLGVAVVPVYSRTPAVLASTALALSHLAGERFILGLGASSHLMVEGWHGLKLEKPLTRMRETTLLLRQMLAGQKAEFDGETLHSHGFRLLQPVKAPVPIYLAGLRPKMLELAGEFGDGVVVNLFPSKALPKMLEHIAVGAARAGKQREQLDIVCRHQVVVTDNPAQARDRFRQRFAPYYATPVYNRYLAWAGYPDVAATIEQGWQAKDRARTTGALSDALVDELAIIGTADECRARILAMARAGITTPIIHPLTTDPEEMRRTLEAFAPERFSVL